MRNLADWRLRVHSDMLGAIGFVCTTHALSTATGVTPETHKQRQLHTISQNINDVTTTCSVEPELRSVDRLRHRFVDAFSPAVRADQVRFERAVSEGRVGGRRAPVQAEVDANDSNVEGWKSGALVIQRALRVELCPS